VNVKVSDLMRAQVVTAQPHQTVEHVRGLLERHRIHAVPVVDTEGRPVGIVSSSDLLGEVKGGAPVSQLMTEKVYTVPAYDDVSVAARVMRNHQIHRVVVTDEQKVVGILSAFDLLQLVEQRRFTMMGAPPPSTRKGAKRA
jgi:CBS domain-containing protein